MNAKRLIEIAHFGPDTLKIAERAFDAAWEMIKPRFNGDAEAARRDLARAVINAVEDSSSDTESVQAAALKEMQQRYPHHFNQS